MIKINLLVIFILLFSNALSQIKSIGILPFVQYTQEQYRAERQNWAALQDNRGIMYFANNQGVLEFDGQNWQKIIVTNNSAVYSLAINKKNQIYVGGKGELGYIEPDLSGTLTYKSLVNLIPEEHRNFEKVWEIFISDENEVFFKTPLAIYIYKNNEFEVITSKNLLILSFMINNKYYVHKKNEGIAIYKNGKLELIPGSDKIAGEMIRAILPFRSDELLIATMSSGFYTYDGKEFKPIKTPINTLVEKELFSAIRLKNGYFAFGLYSTGLLITDENLNAVQHLNPQLGLIEGKVNALYEDNSNNLWLCIENGLTCIQINSPFTTFNETYQLNNYTITSLSKNNTLFVGNPSGIYYKNWDANQTRHESLTPFQLIENPKGKIKVFEIDTIDQNIFCAGELGLFYLENNKINYIIENKSIMRIYPLVGKKEVLLAGSDILFKIYRNDKKWNWKNVKNSERLGRHLQEDTDGSFWASNKNTGIINFRLNSQLDSVTEKTEYTEKNLNGLPDFLDIYIFKINRTIVFATSKGLYYYDKTSKTFKSYNIINQIFDKPLKFVALYENNQGNLFLKTENIRTTGEKEIFYELLYLEKISDAIYKLEKTPYYQFESNIYSINEIFNNQYIIGTKTGFIHYSPQIRKNYHTKYPAFIRKIELITNDSVLFGGTFVNENGEIINAQNENNIPEYPYEYNDLRFTFATAYYEHPEKLTYRYFLEGNDKNWTEWKTETKKEYSNLSYGTYTLYIKAKNIYEVESTIGIYKFKILPPWYKTIWAMILYFILAILLIVLIVKIYTRRLVLEKERLERIVAERTEEIRHQNVELEHKKEVLAKQNDEIRAKNREITASIEYAKRIQQAMLPLEERIGQCLEDYFILFKPRDIVSGDFYWFAESENKLIFTAVDCTGHGVPGAFMSMIGSQILSSIVAKGITDASEILTMKNDYVRLALKQEQTENQDGMDMALCVVDRKNQIVEFAGAKNPLVYIQDGQLFHLKGDKQSIGGHQMEGYSSFTKHIVPIKSPSWFYVFSDGYQDQFGGPDMRKFMIKNMKELIFQNHQKPMQEQKEILNKAIEDWMKKSEQTDDILVIGFKL